MAASTWYANCVLYAVDVERFNDSDGDGVGDFNGFVERLDYFSELGVDCLWLLPFYPTPNRDNGYDITDYYGVDDRLGSLGEFAAFLEAADERDLRVLIDLPVNHTSDEHPWFRKARAGHERYRDYYVWTDDPSETAVEANSIFPGQEEDVWSYDEEAEAYYFHRFYDFEPGLNVANPDVRREIERIMRFWLRLGVDGFRLDAVNHMIEPKGIEGAQPDDPHGVIRELRAFVTDRNPEAVLLGEVDVDPERLGRYFGDGDELQMLFNFLLNNYLFSALARESAEPITRGLALLPPTPEGGQWVTFLRNLDELDLERLSAAERRAVFDVFAPDPEMRIFGRGIRRRIAPLLDSDHRRLRLAFSLLFSLPGSPMIVYGDEIGMGDDLSLDGRSAVRTPMQWSDDDGAGFSAADADALVAPVIDEGPFSYERVNVTAQRDDPDSLFNWLRRLLRTRRESPALVSGTLTRIETEPASVLVYQYRTTDDRLVTIHNLAGESRTIEADLTDSTRLSDVFADREYDPIDPEATAVAIDAYGYRWLRAADEVQ